MNGHDIPDLATLFPGLTRPRKRIYATPKFLEGLPLKPGDEFTIAGLRVDKTKPDGWDRNCEPGQETLLTLQPDMEIEPK